MRSPQSAVHPLLSISVVVFVVLTVMVLSSPFAVILDFHVHDDSFYYLKTAENLAAGHGSTFDGINYTNGYHPAWFALLAALYWLGVGHDAMIPVALSLQSALFLAGLFVLSRAFVATGIKAVFASAAIGIVFVGFLPALAWNLAESGLTVLTSAIVLLAMTRASDSEIRPFWFGLALSIAVLSRTDHLVFVGTSGALLAWQLRRRGRRQLLAGAAAFMTPVLALVGSYLVFNFVTTGHFVQVSGLVKSFQPDWNVADVVGQFSMIDVRSCWKLGMAGAIAFLLRDLRRRSFTGLGAYCLGALVIAAYYLLTYSEGFSFSYWYYIPSYVVFCYSLAWSCHALAASPLRDRPRLVGAAMTVALVSVLAARIYTNAMYRSRTPTNEMSDIYQAALVLRRDLARQPTDRVAAWDAGILGYYGGPVTNLDGLINSADYFERYLSRDRTPEYIRENGFDYLVCYNGDPRVVPMLRDYREVFRTRSRVIYERAR